MFYVSKIIQGLTKDEDLYSSRQIQIPVPRFFMFYNGTKEMPEQWELSLSEACLQPKSRTGAESMLECIREGILGDFLKKNRAEALEMSWYEYNEELHIKNERKIAFEEGVEQERKNTEVQRKIAEEKSRQVQQAEMEIERLKKELDELKKGYSGN